MRIIFIATQLAGGGAEREAAAFASELARMGEEVHVICTHDVKDDYDVDKRVHRHWFRDTHVQIPKLRGAFNTLLMWKLLHALRGDVAVLFYVPFHLAVLLSGTRLVHAVRGNLDKELVTGMDRLRGKLACWCADGVWIQTEGQRCFFPQNQQGKLFVVHNILDSRFLQIRRAYRERMTRFISVGRLHPQKNQRLLIEAFGSMLRQTGNETATLTIYGSAHRDFLWMEESLKKQIRELGLEGRVFLAGRTSHIEKKYEEADVFVFGSNYEGCPNALMEAMAAGLPCISTDCPTGPADLITDGVSGLLVSVGDVKAMAGAMRRLIENPQEAVRFGKAARQRMEDWGTAREHAKRLQGNLQRITKVGSPGDECEEDRV